MIRPENLKLLVKTPGQNSREVQERESGTFCERNQEKGTKGTTDIRSFSRD